MKNFLCSAYYEHIFLIIHMILSKRNYYKFIFVAGIQYRAIDNVTFDKMFFYSAALISPENSSY